MTSHQNLIRACYAAFNVRDPDAELLAVPLDDALEIVCLTLAEEPERFEPPPSGGSRGCWNRGRPRGRALV
jgi:hypothetical protein